MRPNPWFMLIAPIFIACSSARAPTPPGPVNVETWCNSIADRMCELLGTKCGAVSMEMRSDCTLPLVKACIGSRTAAAPSGKMGPDLDKCLAVFDGVACDALKDQSKLDKSKFDVCALPK